MSFGLSIYRIRGILLIAGIVLIFLAMIALLVIEQPEGRGTALLVVMFVGFGLMLVGALFTLLGARLIPERTTITVSSPVTGRWMGINSPATKVPSHGIRAYGQAYAIDLCFEPEPGSRPQFGQGAGMPPARDYPAFGQPVRSMVDGEVVAVVSNQRDHRARSSWLAFGYMMLEGAVREFGGARFVIGNHVIVRHSDGVFALVAHLKKGSTRVSLGDTVRAGEVIAECGNTGNSSEPHVHAQLMDQASPTTAQGIPMAFSGIQWGADATARDGLPVTEEFMVAR